ncbi:MAG: ribosome maturation factor RimM [Clostridiales bacterium]
MDEFILIAEIKTVYNKNGFLSIYSYSDVPGRFKKLGKVYIEIFGEFKEFFVERVILQKNSIALKFRNFNTDKEVGFLLGKKVYVDDENLVKLSEKTFFIHDLIGSRVFRNGSQIGVLIDVMTLPANDVYVMTDNSGKEVLIPAVSDYIESFDVESKLLKLKPGEELYDEDISDKDDED